MKYSKIYLTLLLICSISFSFAQTGEIEMKYHEYITSSLGQNRIVFVWNTKTGQSARYYYDNDIWNKSTASLPENPLGEKSTLTGEIMMDYHEYATSTGGQNRIVFVWNTKTGKSARYYYDNDKWNKSAAALPENPLGEKSTLVGEIMMDYSEYITSTGGQNRMVYVWNTKTGKSARYYYDNDAWRQSTANLPVNPLK